MGGVLVSALNSLCFCMFCLKSGDEYCVSQTPNYLMLGKEADGLVIDSYRRTNL